MAEVTIYAVVGQYNCSERQARELQDEGAIYFCGTPLEDCPFVSFPENPKDLCEFWHFTADFQDTHEDNFEAMCDTVDAILRRE